MRYGMVGVEELHVLVQYCTGVYDIVRSRKDTSVMVYNNMVVIEGGRKKKRKKNLY